MDNETRLLILVALMIALMMAMVAIATLEIRSITESIVEATQALEELDDE